MPSRKALLVLLVAAATVVLLDSRYRNLPMAPPSPIAMAAEAELAPADHAIPRAAPPPSPAADGKPARRVAQAATPPSSPSPDVRLSLPVAASPASTPWSRAAPAAPAARSSPSSAEPAKAIDPEDNLQSVTYVVGNTSAQTAMKILKIAAPDAQFTAGEDKKKLTVVATPADHKKIRTLVVTELGSSLADAPHSAAPHSAGPHSAVPVPDTPKRAMRSAQFDIRHLDSVWLLPILEAAAPKSGFTLQGDGKALTVSGPEDECERVTKIVTGMLKALSGPAVMYKPAPAASPRFSNRAQAPRGSSYYAPYPGGAPYYQPVGAPRKSADPEMAKHEEADANAAKQVAELVKEYKAASGEDEQKKARSNLRQAVLEHFAVRQAKRETEVTRLEARLEKVRESISKRTELQDQIVDRRIAQLLGEPDELEF